MAIRGVLAYPTGITFALLIAIRGREMTTGADYRWITGNGLPHQTYSEGVRGLVLQARVQDAAAPLTIHTSGGGGASTNPTSTRAQYVYWLALPADAKAVTFTATWPDLVEAPGTVNLPLDDVWVAAARAVTV